MTNREFCEKFYVIAPGVPIVNPGDVPILRSNSKAYIPGLPANNADAKCEEYETEEEAKKAYPNARIYITVGSG